MRVAAWLAYRPALFYTDSWGYLKMARAGHGLVGIAPTRPSGYPLALRVLTLDGHSLGALTAAQHLAGLAVGVLLYGLLVRWGVARWMAALATGLVVLDAYGVALEARVLSEALFTLALLACVYLLLAVRQRPAGLAASGVLLAVAATMRPVALFVVPVWLGYLALGRLGWRPFLAALGGLGVPLALYAALHASVTGTFGLTQADGWFLYGRVGEIVRCGPSGIPASERPLCTNHGGGPVPGPDYFIFQPDSPARRLLGAISANPRRQAHSNALLRDFAVRTIVSRPGAYAHIVTADFARFFSPGASAGAREDATVSLPRHVRLTRDDRRARVGLPSSYRPHARAPAGPLSAYASWVHTPRWLLAILTLASLLAVVLGLPRARAVSLLVGCALAMLVGSAATAGFALRYLLPTVPLLVGAGVLAGVDLLALARRRGRHPSSPATGGAP